MEGTKRELEIESKKYANHEFGPSRNVLHIHGPWGKLFCGKDRSARRETYVEPVAWSAAVHRVFAAFVAIHHRPLVVHRLVPRLGLLNQRVGHLLPSFLEDDRELVPAVVVEERHH